MLIKNIMSLTSFLSDRLKVGTIRDSCRVFMTIHGCDTPTTIIIIINKITIIMTENIRRKR